MVTWCSFLHAAYRRCNAYTNNKNKNNKVLPTSPALVQNNRIAVISGKADYMLSFDITPTGTIGDFGSILHFTTDNNCCNFGQRSPAIWFHQGTTRLYVAIGDSTDGNWRLDTDALPLNVRTKITLECKGKDVKLTVGKKVYTATQPTYRFSGNLIVYAGDPWYSVATAEISNLYYKILFATEINEGKTFILMMIKRMAFFLFHFEFSKFEMDGKILLQSKS